MPTYAYACTSCDHEFDVQQSFSDSSLTDCPECEGRLRKKFGAVGVVFKGSGFYRTDSRAGSSGSSGSSDKGSETANGTSDTKPSTGDSGSSSASSSAADKKSDTAAASTSGATSESSKTKANGSAKPVPSSSPAA